MSRSFPLRRFLEIVFRTSNNIPSLGDCPAFFGGRTTLVCEGNMDPFGIFFASVQNIRFSMCFVIGV